MTNREIDALVAEKVMGWKLDRRIGYGWPVVPEAFVPSCKYPDYSESIAAAWQVVEKMRADDWLVSIKANTPVHRFKMQGSRSEYDAPEPDIYVGGTGKCVCELSCMRGDDKPYRPSEFAIADTAPMAICLAALAAVGVEVPK